MNSRDRVLGCLEYKGYDRIPVKHEGTPEIDAQLRKHLGLANDEQLRLVLGDDFRYVAPRYTGPELETFADGSIEGYFGERYVYKNYDGGKYLEASHLPFKGITELKDLDRSHYPSADWFDYTTIKEQAGRFRASGFAVCHGSAGDMDFINGISRARGMEQVLMDLYDDNEVYLDIMQARFQFYFQTHERVLQAADGLIDFTHIGEDLGTQTGPLVGMDIFDKHFAPRYEEYFTMAHSYGARAIMHMCGTVHPFLRRLIDIGLDIYDVVQPTTPDNDICALKLKFGQDLAYRGSMDVQKELVFGTVEDVEREVQRRLETFPLGGLILGPSHAIQVKSPIANILAMYRRAGSLLEPIPEWVYDVSGAED